MMHQSLLQWSLLCTVVIQAAKVEFHGSNFTNMEVYDGKIYIGAANKILVLNATNLKSIKTVITCTGTCDNINKVLVINEKMDQLITCGTGHGGICEIRNLSNSDDVLHKSRNDSYFPTFYLVVSTNEKRPACFIKTADSNVLYTGVTFGAGIREGTHGSYDFYLSKTSITENRFRQTGEHLNLNLYQTDVEDYLVYFKAVFQHQGFIYFLTNQKFKVGSSRYTSKIIRICENDTHFYSYTDILLKCIKPGTDYNLVQDVSFIEPGEDLGTFVNTSTKIMAATFAVGSNPERPDGHSAVCIYSIEEIDKKIMEAKKHFITCPWKNWLLEERYLHDLRRSRCMNLTEMHVS